MENKEIDLLYPTPLFGPGFVFDRMIVTPKSNWDRPHRYHTDRLKITWRLSVRPSIHFCSQATDHSISPIKFKLGPETKLI